MNDKRAAARTRQLRKIALLAHRYVGLAMAAFLIVAGLTGSMMAFYPQLDLLLNPELCGAKRPADGRPTLDPFVLREKLIAQLPPKDVKALQGVVLDIDPDRAANYWVDGREVFVDPYSGKVNGSRTFGSLSEGKKSILTFFYELHFTLGLGEVGRYLFGCVALLWTLDCFVGAYLTFPLPARGGEGSSAKSWFARWWPAWLIKTSKLFSLIFSWHRASGLWFWLMFLIFAWSAVALNLSDVYEPVMIGIFGEPPKQKEPAELAIPRDTPKLQLRDAHQRGKTLMAAEAKRRGLHVFKEVSLYYEPEHGTYGYTVESDLDTSERLAETAVIFDGDTGEQQRFYGLTGEHTGTTVGSWLIALHFGAVRAGGLAYRSLVCALGVVVALLSISGVWIWWKKRSSRSHKVVRARAHVPAARADVDAGAARRARES